MGQREEEIKNQEKNFAFDGEWLNDAEVSWPQHFHLSFVVIGVGVVSGCGVDDRSCLSWLISGGVMKQP